MTNTVGIIGTGRVGATIAYALITNNLVSRILLLDSNTERCKGEELDLSDVLAFSRAASIEHVCFKDLEKADIIIIAAGKAQKDAHESRDELALSNASIIQDICAKLPPLKKTTKILIITNPVDLMTRVAIEALTDHPRTHIFGSGTWLDTQRLRRIIGQQLSVAPESINAFVIGEHGDSQIVPWQYATIGYTPITQWNLTKTNLDTIEQQTKTTVYDIIAKKQATYFGIASCAVDICSALLFDEKRILPLSWSENAKTPAYSLPAIIGKNGIEKQLKPSLNNEESLLLQASIKKLDSAWHKLSKHKKTGSVAPS